MNDKIKYIVCIMVGITFSVLATTGIVRAKQMQVQKTLAQEVFRFHVLANSDSEEDQELKLKVKTAIISFMKKELPESNNAQETKSWAESHLDELEMVATHVIEEEGYEYGVVAGVTRCYFPEKTYGDVTFPAGAYDALRVEIGEAKGQNWWCVLYPNLCFFDAIHAVVPDEGKEDLKEVLEEDAYEMVTSKTRFKIGWFFF